MPGMVLGKVGKIQLGGSQNRHEGSHHQDAERLEKRAGIRARKERAGVVEHS